MGKIFKCIWKVLFGPFTKYYGLWSSDLSLANYQHLKIQDFTSLLLTRYLFFLSIFYLIFLPTTSHEQLRPKPIKHTIFCKNSMRSSTCTQRYCPNCDESFALIRRKEMKLAISDIPKALTLELNMITRQMTPFFSSTPLVCFTLRPSKFSSIESTLYIKFCSVKYTFHVKENTFKPVNIDILIQCKTC